MSSSGEGFTLQRGSKMENIIVHRSRSEGDWVVISELGVEGRYTFISDANALAKRLRQDDGIEVSKFGGVS